MASHLLSRSSSHTCVRFCQAISYALEKPEFSALTHPNLQIDNGFFWRSDGGELEAGLLDWYGLTRAPFASIFMGCLSGAEADVLTAHLEGLLSCFAAEYEKCGGPQIDPVELLLQFKLLYVMSMIQSFSFIDTDVYREGPPRPEWASIESKDDERVMGNWNVRCRVIAIIQGLAFWKKQVLGTHWAQAPHCACIGSASVHSSTRMAILLGAGAALDQLPAPSCSLSRTFTRFS